LWKKFHPKIRKRIVYYQVNVFHPIYHVTTSPLNVFSVIEFATCHSREFAAGVCATPRLQQRGVAITFVCCVCSTSCSLTHFKINKEVKETATAYEKYNTPGNLVHRSRRKRHIQKLSLQYVEIPFPGKPFVPFLYQDEMQISVLGAVRLVERDKIAKLSAKALGVHLVFIFVRPKTVVRP
jgi:hypothetical protein